MSDGRTRLRLALSTLGSLAGAWSLLLVMTSGVSFTVGPLHVSSRNARNPAIGALVMLALAALCAPPGVRIRTVVRDLLRPWPVLARPVGRIADAARPALLLASHPITVTLLALALSLTPVVVSWTKGVYVAGGSDSYGYVSEGHLLATGRMRFDVPLMRTFPNLPPAAFSPLGYRTAVDGSASLVPMYAPGLPLTMAVAERMAGGMAVYAVMPILAAVAVWSTYRIGRQLAGGAVGLGAAVLLLTSPAFLFQLMGAPMSDVPAAGWWALALSLLLPERRWPALFAGAAAGAAILTRPNLLLVVVIPGIYLLWHALRRPERREPFMRLALFSGPVVAACLTVAVFNASWYGSPLRSGYSIALFSLGFWRDNLANYTRWLTETQTPLFLLAFVAPFVAGWLSPAGAKTRRDAILMLVGVALTVLASYLFYTPFGAWWFLRFLVPAFPAVAVLTCVTLAALAARFGLAGRALAIAALAFAVTVSVQYARQFDSAGESRYRIIGEWVRDHLPENAIVLSMQHSGSIQHYSGRATVRYDFVPRDAFDATVTDMLAAGYHPYLVVDDWEVEEVRGGHGNRGRAALDWAPVAELSLGEMRVWDLAADRDTARASGRTPEQVPIPEAVRRRLP